MAELEPGTPPFDNSDSQAYRIAIESMQKNYGLYKPGPDENLTFYIDMDPSMAIDTAYLRLANQPTEPVYPLFPPDDGYTPVPEGPSDKTSFFSPSIQAEATVFETPVNPPQTKITANEESTTMTRRHFLHNIGKFLKRHKPQS